MLGCSKQSFGYNWTVLPGRTTWWCYLHRFCRGRDFPLKPQNEACIRYEVVFIFFGRPTPSAYCKISHGHRLRQKHHLFRVPLLQLTTQAGQFQWSNGRRAGSRSDRQWWGHRPQQHRSNLRWRRLRSRLIWRRRSRVWGAQHRHPG